MSVKKFKFVSPGVFINEIDNSQLTKQGDDIGPVIIGTSLRGPSMVPTRIESFSDFVETFGEPLSGSEGADVWREGNRLAPTYAAYAAQAYLRNSSPVTFVRLLGEAHPDGSDKAGWEVKDPAAAFDAGNDDAAGAYGLFIANGGVAPVASKGTIQVSGVTAASAGFTYNFPTQGAQQEVSMEFEASKVIMVANTGSEYVSPNQLIEVTNIGSSNLSRVYSLSSDATVGADVTVAGGATATAVAAAVAAHINSVDGDILEAANAGANLIIRNKARGPQGGSVLAADSKDVGGGAGSGSCATGLDAGRIGAFSSPAGGYTFDAGDFNTNSTAAADVFSIAAAAESLGLALGSLSSNPSLDEAVAKLVATHITAAGAIDGRSYSATAAKESDLSKTVITVVDNVAGAVAGGGKAISVSGAPLTGSTMDGGSDVTLLGQQAALAAIVYAKSGSVALEGIAASRSAGKVRGVGIWVKSDGAGNQFKLAARNVAASGATPDAGDKTELIAFNFSKNSRLYIREVLNTNPTLANSNLVLEGKKKGYFLGETFDQHLASVQKEAGVGAGSKGAQYACLIPLVGGGDHTSDASQALTPWIISQHNGAPADLNTSDSALLASGDVESLGIEKLMRFHSLYAGQWERKNLKIAIEDIKAPTDKFNPYGTFSVVIRKSEDSDAAPQVVERFSSCNLNPASADYVGKKVGDMRMVWDDAERRYQSHGQYENQSRFIRVEVSTSVESGSADARMLPFGFLGPRKRKDITFTNSVSPLRLSGGGTDSVLGQALNSGVRHVQQLDGSWSAMDSTNRITVGPNGDTATSEDSSLAFSTVFKFPAMSLRKSSADSTLSSSRDANFGVSVAQVGTDNTFDESYMDLSGFCGFGVQSDNKDPSDVGANDTHQFIFTLDDIRYPKTVAEGGDGTDGNLASSPPRNFIWDAGSRASSGSSSTASITAFTPASGTPNGFTAILDKGVRGFSLPLLGGHDGVDICEIHPFAYHSESNKGGRPDSDDSTLDHYALNSLKKAVDTVADPEVVDMNILAAPGVTHPSITNHMISVCERRGDALAIIDLDKDYMPMGLDISKSEEDRMPDVDKAINSLRERSINSSYGCAFFPWVQIADTNSGRVLWAPPSLAALGTMASSSRKSELWFAPAGFTRGGLTDGAAGLPVSAVRLRLNSKERDKLYEANINPIAQFPAEGIVIFGQKTLQLTPSALDRINVRRLMIFLKKSISRMAKTVLFDQNVESTWSRFTSKADPFLASVQSRFGLSEYKIILDKTTTTTELVDRNIMYAKILLKPTRAIEYIAIDFVITDSGASFDD